MMDTSYVINGIAGKPPICPSQLNCRNYKTRFVNLSFYLFSKYLTKLAIGCSRFLVKLQISTYMYKIVYVTFSCLYSHLKEEHLEKLICITVVLAIV